MEVGKWRYAICSGLFASIASLFGKMTGIVLEQNELLIHVSCFLLMICCNVFVWRFYVKALNSDDDGTIKVTIINVASNYIFSFLLGILVFKETISIMSAFGIALIVIGIFIIVNGQEDKPKKLS